MQIGGTGLRLDDRQRREREYHQAFAARHRDKADRPVNLDVVLPGPRRPWNGYWTAYDLLMEAAPAGKRVLIPGCGFGEDAIRLAKLGADVYASDLSPDLVDIARRRAVRMDVPGIHFDVMAAEALSYPDDFFDLVFFNDILHHVHIPRAVAAAKRVLRPGGRVVANELYTHAILQRVRDSRLVTRFLYRRMVGFIYGTRTPYITADEHKISDRELAILEGILMPDARCLFFLCSAGRIFPPEWLSVQKLDHALLNVSPVIGRRLAGRVVLAATVRK